MVQSSTIDDVSRFSFGGRRRNLYELF